MKSLKEYQYQSSRSQGVEEISRWLWISEWLNDSAILQAIFVDDLDISILFGFFILCLASLANHQTIVFCMKLVVEIAALDVATLQQVYHKIIASKEIKVLTIECPIMIP